MIQKKNLVMLGMIGLVILGLIVFYISNDKPEQIIHNTKTQQNDLQAQEIEVVDQVNSVEATIPETNSDTVVKHEVTFDPVYRWSIPKFDYDFLNQSGVMTRKGAHFFEADFTPFLTAKVGDEVSIDLGGTVYNGTVTEVRDLRSGEPYLTEDDDGNEVWSNELAPYSKHLAFKVDLVDELSDMQFRMIYYPNEERKLQIARWQINDRIYTQDLIFDVSNGHGVYLTQQQFRENWNKLEIGGTD